MERSQDATYALSRQILGLAQVGPILDYDRTLLSALERVRLSGFAVNATGGISLSLGPTTSATWVPAVLGADAGLVFDKALADTTNSPGVVFAIDGVPKWEMGMDVLGYDFVPAYRVGVGDVIRVNPNMRVVIGPGIGTPTDDASLEITGPATSNKQFILRGTLTGGGSDAVAQQIETMLTPAANQSAFGLLLAPQFTEAASGSHQFFMTADFHAPSIVPGAAALGTAITMLVRTASGGTDNVTFWAYGGGISQFDGPVGLIDGQTAPTTKAGYAQLYVDTSDGDLKVKFGDGTIKTIVVDT